MRGAFKLDHLQPVEPILSGKFSNFGNIVQWWSRAAAPKTGLYRKGETENGKIELSQPECERGISVPGAFKLDHLQPVEPILFCKFSNFLHFYTGCQFLLPQRGEE